MIAHGSNKREIERIRNEGTLAALRGKLDGLREAARLVRDAAGASFAKGDDAAALALRHMAERLHAFAEEAAKSAECFKRSAKL